MTKKQVIVAFALAQIVCSVALAFWVFAAYRSSGGWLLLLVAFACIGGAVVGLALWMWARNLGRGDIDQNWPPI